MQGTVYVVLTSFYIRDLSVSRLWYPQGSWDQSPTSPIDTEGWLKFLRNLKLYVDFQLHGGLTPIIPALFKGQLYAQWLCHTVLIPFLNSRLTTWNTHLDFYKVYNPSLFILHTSQACSHSLPQVSNWQFHDTISQTKGIGVSPNLSFSPSYQKFYQLPLPILSLEYFLNNLLLK